MSDIRNLAKEGMARIIHSEFFGVANARRDAERSAERIMQMLDAASVDTRPEGGDAPEIAAPFTSGAVGSEADETPKGGSHAPNH